MFQRYGDRKHRKYCFLPLCRLAPDLRRTLAVIRINLTLPETRDTSLLPIVWVIVWVYLHSNFCGRLRKKHVSCNRVCILAFQGHPRSKACMQLSRSLVLNSNLGPNLACFRHITGFLQKNSHPFNPREICRCWGGTVENAWMENGER